MKLPVGYVAGVGVVKATAYGGFGEKMLKSMGWQDGQGLGKEGTGMKKAIEVKKKEDTNGVGADSSYKWDDKWWERAFDSAAQTVDHSDDSASSSDSDDDPVHAPGTNRDGTRSSASAHELRLLASLSKSGRVAAGRFGGRDAKLARIRQQEAALAAEAAAKLGVPAPAAVAGDSGRSDTTGDRTVSGSKASAGKEKKKGRKTKKGSSKAEEGAAAAADVAAEAPPAKKGRLVIEPVSAACMAAVAEFVPTPATGWWGERRFASAGCLEGLAPKPRSDRQAFDEGDQEALYMRAQAKKAQGKVGLGQGTGSVRVGGVKWEGKKVTFEEAEGAAGPDDPGRAQLHAAGSSTCLAGLGDRPAGKAGRRRKHTAKESESSAAPGGDKEPATAGWEGRVKWRKLVSGLLRAAPGSELKLAALRKQVAAALADKLAGEAPPEAELRRALHERLAASSKFVVSGKSVRLA